MQKLLTAAAVVLLSATSLMGQQSSIVDTAVSAGNFQTLVAAVKAAGLAGTLSGGEFTVFAPTDEAFAKLEAGTVESLLEPENRDLLVSILTYHVVEGRVDARAAYPLTSARTVNGQRLAIDLQSDSPTIGDAGLVKTDIQCSNGVIHVIDSVLMPATKTIPEVATEAGSFGTLLAAAKAAGMAEALSGKGPFTVFAPTDEAFGKLPAGTVESLLKPENKGQLAEILQYHVIPARVYATDAAAAVTAGTLLGQSVRTSVSESGLAVNDAHVISADVEASNGVIHVIDSVLLPSDGISRSDAIGMIRDSIKQGAAVFNAGHAQQCSQLYMSTLKQLSGEGIEGADSQTIRMIRDTLGQAAQMHDANERAWALRRCMDTVYSRISRMPETVR